MSAQRIAKHKYVQFIYEIVDESGMVVEKVDMPLNYVHGTDSGPWEKIEHALEGQEVGACVHVTLEPEDAFGEPDPALTFTDDIANVPEQFRYLGAEVEMQNDRGESKTFRVAKIENGKLTVDGNHPLAGQTVTFNVTVTDVRDPTPEELAGAAAPGGLGRLH